MPNRVSYRHHVRRGLVRNLAKRAFLFLAKRHHLDQGGTYHDFLRVKDTYDRALAVWRRAAEYKFCCIADTGQPESVVAVFLAPAAREANRSSEQAASPLLRQVMLQNRARKLPGECNQTKKNASEMK